MYKKFLFSFLLVFIVTICSGVLPISAAGPYSLPTGPVDVHVDPWNYPPSYFPFTGAATIDGTGPWGVWCVDSTTPYGDGPAFLYSSLDVPSLPPNLQLIDWNRINYIINHYGSPTYAASVQYAIWYFTYVDFFGNPPFALFPPAVTEAQPLVEAAILNGAGYIPGYGDLFAIIISWGEGIQPLITVGPRYLGRTPGYWGNWKNHYSSSQITALANAINSNSNFFGSPGVTLTSSNIKTILLASNPTGKMTRAKAQTMLIKHLLATWCNVKSYLDWSGDEPISGFPGSIDTAVNPNYIVDLAGWTAAAALFGPQPTVGEIINSIESNIVSTWTTDELLVAKDVLDKLNNAQLLLLMAP